MRLHGGKFSCASNQYLQKRDIIMTRVLLTGASGFIAREYSSSFTRRFTV